MIGFLKRFVERVREVRAMRSLYPMMIIHLYSLSTVTSSPRDVITLAGNSKYALGELTKVFAKVSTLTRRWNYTTHRAIQLVSSSIKEEKVRGFLQRLSYSLNMGVNLESYMKIEYEKLLETSSAEFERAVERVKRYIEAYSALLTSTTFLSVSMLLTSIIYGMDAEKVLVYSLAMIAASLAMTVFLMARNLPQDPLIHGESVRPATLKLIERVTPAMIVSCIAASVALMLSLNRSVEGDQTIIGAISPIPISLIVPGIPLLILGSMGKKWVKQAERMDEHYPAFIKSFGDAISVTSSLKDASRILEVNDYGPMNVLIRRLRRRLEAGFGQNKSLVYMGLESTSNLVLRTVRVIADSMFYGARSDVYTKSIYDYVIRVLIDRKKRKQTAGTLKGLVIPLQATLVAVTALISVLTRILYRFGLLIRDWFPLLLTIHPTHVSAYFYSIILVSAISSSIAVYVVEGDSRFTLSYFLGTLLTLSGATYLLVSLGSEQLFSLFTSFEKEMTEMLGEL